MHSFNFRFRCFLCHHYFHNGREMMDWFDRRHESTSRWLACQPPIRHLVSSGSCPFAHAALVPVQKQFTHNDLFKFRKVEMNEHIILTIQTRYVKPTYDHFLHQQERKQTLYNFCTYRSRGTVRFTNSRDHIQAEVVKGCVKGVIFAVRQVRLISLYTANVNERSAYCDTRTFKTDRAELISLKTHYIWK